MGLSAHTNPWCSQLWQDHEEYPRCACIQREGARHIQQRGHQSRIESARRRTRRCLHHLYHQRQRAESRWHEIFKGYQYQQDNGDSCQGILRGISLPSEHSPVVYLPSQKDDSPHLLCPDRRQVSERWQLHGFIQI